MQRSLMLRLGTGACCAAAALVLAGCSTVTQLETVGAQQALLPDTCPVRIYRRPEKPDGRFDTLAKVETHVQRNIFFGGRATLERDAYAELQIKACRVGGNGVLVEDWIESSAAEMTHVHVWATVIRSQPTPR